MAMRRARRSRTSVSTWAAATRSAAVSSACCVRSKRAVSADDTLALAAAGDLVVTGHALAVLGFRMTLQALAGADPSGSEAAVRKLLGVQHDQHVQEVGMVEMGADAAADAGDAAAWVGSFLFNRCLTIAGGTSDIQRNVIAERLLGLPRDP